MLCINDIDTSAALDVCRTGEDVVLVGDSHFCWFGRWRLVRSRTLRKRRRRSRSIHLYSLEVIVFICHLLRDELLLVVHAKIVRRLGNRALLQSKDRSTDKGRNKKTRDKKEKEEEVALGLAPLVDVGLGTDRDSLVESRSSGNSCKVDNIVNLDSARSSKTLEPVLDILLEGIVLGDSDGSPDRLTRNLSTPDVVGDSLDNMRNLEESDVAGITLGSENSKVSIALISVLEAIRTLEILHNSLLTCSCSKIDLGTAGSGHDVHVKRWVSLGTCTSTSIGLELNTEEETSGLSRNKDTANEAAEDSLTRSSAVRTNSAAIRDRDSRRDARARNSRRDINRNAQCEAHIVCIIVASVLDGNSDISKTAVLRSKKIALELKTSLSQKLHRPAKLEPGTLGMDGTIRKVLSLNSGVSPVKSVGSNTVSDDGIARLNLSCMSADHDVDLCNVRTINSSNLDRELRSTDCKTRSKVDISDIACGRLLRSVLAVRKLLDLLGPELIEARELTIGSLLVRVLAATKTCTELLKISFLNKDSLFGSVDVSDAHLVVDVGGIAAGVEDLAGPLAARTIRNTEDNGRNLNSVVVDASRVTNTREVIKVLADKLHLDLIETTTEMVWEVLGDVEVIVVVTLPAIADGNNIDGIKVEEQWCNTHNILTWRNGDVRLDLLRDGQIQEVVCIGLTKCGNKAIQKIIRVDGLLRNKSGVDSILKHVDIKTGIVHERVVDAELSARLRKCCCSCIANINLHSKVTITVVVSPDRKLPFTLNLCRIADAEVVVDIAVESSSVSGDQLLIKDKIIAHGKNSVDRVVDDEIRVRTVSRVPVSEATTILDLCKTLILDIFGRKRSEMVDDVEILEGITTKVRSKVEPITRSVSVDDIVNLTDVLGRVVSLVALEPKLVG